MDFLNCLDYSNQGTQKDFKSPPRKNDGTGKFFRQPLPPPLLDKSLPRKYARYGVPSSVIKEKITLARPDLVLITTGMTYWYPGVREAVQEVKGLFPSVPVIAGGIYATLMPDHCRDVCGAGHIITGSGEDELRSFLGMNHFPVPSGALPDRPMLIPGIWDEAGIIRLNRGCPLRCAYCASGLICDGFTPGNPDKGWKALMELHHFAGTRNFAFYDDALLYRKEEVFIPFLKRIIREECDFNFYTPNAVHLRYLDRETAKLMVDAGFREIRLGYESSSCEFHKKRDGKFHPASFPGKIEELKKAGFSHETIRVYILAGLPGQEAGEVEESILHAKDAGVRISLSEYSPVPGSAMWDECLNSSSHPLAEEPLYHNNTLFPMEWEGFTRNDLERLKRLTR